MRSTGCAGLLSFWSAETDLDPGALMTADRFAAEIAHVLVEDVERCRELRKLSGGRSLSGESQLSDTDRPA